MTRPLITVVLETVTPQTSVAGGSIADRLAEPLAALAAQTWPQDRIEPVVVVGREVPAAEREEIARRYPHVVLASSAPDNYFDAKNQGAAAGSGEIVTFLDGDCTPRPDWLEKLIGRFEEGVTGVAGCVRYEDKGVLARALSVPDFGYILTERDGLASGFNLGNVAFRRDEFLANPLDARIVRNGGCYNLFHQLRAKGARIVYEPEARVSHALDFVGLSFFKKHWARGYEGLKVYQLDERGTFRGTAWYRRFGPLALVALSGRRILVDWARLTRHRKQIGVSLAALPACAALGAGLRLVELAGSVAASLRRERVSAPDGAAERHA
ncbi:MAG TPA: glycosyltransferase [Allosphingosinicella sp.]|jgi:glycosyltransferase involved in cell wall biosynthesis